MQSFKLHSFFSNLSFLKFIFHFLSYNSEFIQIVDEFLTLIDIIKIRQLIFSSQKIVCYLF